MNILMMTNTYTPHVGGVARSVESFTNEYRKRGHRVLVVAPEFANMPQGETGVLRVRAIQHFNGSDFSVALPIPGALSDAIESFDPDIVHSHHPFLIGATAVRVAYTNQLPLVFTHHTMYEQYTHYVPGDSPAMKRFVVQLSTSYANLCDQVFAPSESVAAVLQQRGVTAPVDVVPTGVHTEQYSHGDGMKVRRELDIPGDALVIGHLGRLAPEKNLDFLARAAAEFLDSHAKAHFLVIGVGPSRDEIEHIFDHRGLTDRLHFVGILKQQELADALHAMNVFVFASRSETQGMVLTEAMAARLPVIALDAPGVREVVVDYQNGRLLKTDELDQFVAAMKWFASLDDEDQRRLRNAACETARSFSIERTADKALTLYESLIDQEFVNRDEEYNVWTGIRGLIRFEWDMVKGIAEATGAAFSAREHDDNAVR
jgi:glycosyltransferase involved in cell wall biosynthesis